MLDQPSIARQAIDERVEALRGEPQRRADLLAGDSRPQRRTAMRSREPALHACRQRVESLASDQRVTERHGLAVRYELGHRRLPFRRFETAPCTSLVRRAGHVERREKPRGGGGRGPAFERLHRFAPAAHPLARHVGDHPASERLGRRRPPEDEPIADGQRHGFGEAQLRPRRCAGVEHSALQQRDTRHHLGRTDVHLHRFVVSERARCRGQERKSRRYHRRRLERTGPCDNHAARELVLLDAGEIQRDAASGAGALQSTLVGLDPANPRALRGRKDRDLIPDGEGPIHQRSRDDRAEPREREGAIDRQPRPAGVVSARRRHEDLREGAHQVVEPAPRCRGHLDERGVPERRVLKDRCDIGFREGGPFVIHEIALGERDDAAVDAEDPEDGEVLARLRHHSFVERDDQQHRVDRSDTREHVADEVLMAGDVDDTHVAAAGKLEPREAEVDRHAALALLVQAIRVYSGERGDER